MVKEAIDVVFPGKKVVIKDDVEPQSEVEEVKQDVELMDAIIRETKLFNDAVKNYGITHEEDLLQLKEWKRSFLLENSKMQKFEKSFEPGFKVYVDNIDTQISQLEKQLAKNKDLASLVLIEVQLIFKNALAKLISNPEIPTAIKPLQTHTREVLIKTTEPGYGNNYEHPAKIDFENPISAIYHLNNSNPYLKFATEDGVIGAHPPNYQDNNFVKVGIVPANSAIAKIQVWKTSHIHGIKMFDKSG